MGHATTELEAVTNVRQHIPAGLVVQSIFAQHGAEQIFVVEDTRHTGSPGIQRLLHVIPVDAAWWDEVADRARQLSEADRPHVARVLEFGRVGEGYAYFLYDLFSSSLLTALPAHGLGPNNADHVLREIAAGLATLHRSGLAHGNLGPDCILLRRQPLNDHSELTLAAVATGAIPFLSEGRQSSGRDVAFLPPGTNGTPAPSAVDDVYAFGVLALQVILGTKAVHNCSHSQLLKKVANVSRHKEWLARALDANPQNRLKSGSELLTAIDKSTAAFGTAATWLYGSLGVAVIAVLLLFVGMTREIEQLRASELQTRTKLREAEDKVIVESAKRDTAEKANGTIKRYNSELTDQIDHLKVEKDRWKKECEDLTAENKVLKSKLGGGPQSPAKAWWIGHENEDLTTLKAKLKEAILTVSEKGDIEGWITTVGDIDKSHSKRFPGGMPATIKTAQRDFRLRPWDPNLHSALVQVVYKELVGVPDLKGPLSARLEKLDSVIPNSSGLRNELSGYRKVLNEYVVDEVNWPNVELLKTALNTGAVAPWDTQQKNRIKELVEGCRSARDIWKKFASASDTESFRIQCNTAAKAKGPFVEQIVSEWLSKGLDQHDSYELEIDDGEGPLNTEQRIVTCKLHFLTTRL